VPGCCYRMAPELVEREGVEPSVFAARVLVLQTSDLATSQSLQT